MLAPVEELSSGEEGSSSDQESEAVPIGEEVNDSTQEPTETEDAWWLEEVARYKAIATPNVVAQASASPSTLAD
ncbi:unnamed protein product [Calypogeia fissa]